VPDRQSATLEVSSGLAEDSRPLSSSSYLDAVRESTFVRRTLLSLQQPITSLQLKTVKYVDQSQPVHCCRYDNSQPITSLQVKPIKYVDQSHPVHCCRYGNSQPFAISGQYLAIHCDRFAAQYCLCDNDFCKYLWSFFPRMNWVKICLSIFFSLSTI